MPTNDLWKTVTGPLAEKLYRVCPCDKKHGESNCWVAACDVAVALVKKEYTALEFKEVADFYGLENVDV